MLLITSLGEATIPADANTGQACRRVVAVGSSPAYHRLRRQLGESCDAFLCSGNIPAPGRFRDGFGRWRPRVPDELFGTLLPADRANFGGSPRAELLF